MKRFFLIFLTVQAVLFGIEMLNPVQTAVVHPWTGWLAKASAAMFQCYLFDINGLDAGGNGQSCVLDPSGRVIHQCGTTEELVPVEIDLEQVRHQRVRGMRTLGQPMKSFRDSKVRFSIYEGRAADLRYLDSLGPLAKPQRTRQAEDLDPIEAVAAE